MAFVVHFHILHFNWFHLVVSNIHKNAATSPALRFQAIWTKRRTNKLYTATVNPCQYIVNSYEHHVVNKIKITFSG